MEKPALWRASHTDTTRHLACFEKRRDGNQMPFESQSIRKELNGKVIFTSDTWMACVEREGSRLTPSLQSVAFVREEGSREPMGGGAGLLSTMWHLGGHSHTCGGFGDETIARVAWLRGGSQLSAVKLIQVSIGQMENRNGRQRTTPRRGSCRGRFAV